MLLRDLAEKIRSQRERRGLRQADIANALNISPQAVSKWERGENAPDIAVLRPLTRLLGVSTDWLLDVHHEDRDVFEAAVLVSSIHGAHERSLNMEPRDFATWANGIFFALTEAVLKNDGVPIKYMGDQFLCFFSGVRHCARALDAALRARKVVSEDLRAGLSRGDIYLDSVGHPDYARPDVMGEVVNLAFLTHGWAEENAPGGVAMTREFLDGLDGEIEVAASEEVRFRGVVSPVTVCALK